MTKLTVPRKEESREPSRSNRPRPEPLAPDTFPHQPPRGSSRLPLTLENVEHLLDGYDIKPRYNVIKKALELQAPEVAGVPFNVDSHAMTVVLSLAALNNLPRGDLESYVAALGDRNPYNPVREWIESKPWDGTDRIAELAETLVVADDYDEALRHVIVYRWVLSAVAAVTRPNFRTRGVLTLQGPQGIGKTTWIRNLVPEPLRDSVLKTDLHLDPTNKDSVIMACTHWIVEVGELEASFRKEVARLKGFITADYDKVRKPYAKIAVDMPRTTVFAATVNQHDFLVDDTGNSRWWVVRLAAIRPNDGMDMQQVFAQALSDLNQGAKWWLTPSEEAALAKQTNAHRRTTAVEERFLDAIDDELRDHPSLAAMTPTEVLGQLGIEKPTNQQCRECGRVLRLHLGDPKRIGGRERWRVPFKDQA